MRLHISTSLIGAYLLVFLLSACSSDSGIPDDDLSDGDDEPDSIVDGEPDDDRLPPADGDPETEAENLENLIDGDELPDGDVITDGDWVDGELDIDPDEDQEMPLLAISEVLVSANPNNVLSAVLTFETNVSAYPSVEVMETLSRNTRLIGPGSEPAKSHEIWILGLHTEKSYTFTARAETAGGESSQAAAETFVTLPLPEAVPKITVKKSEPEKMAPGYTMINVEPWKSDKLGAVIIVDSLGEVVWYRADMFPHHSMLLSNGNILYTRGLMGMVEVDWLGRIVNEWYATSLPDIESIHHDVYEMENGHFLFLGSELRLYPYSEVYPEAADGDGGPEGWVSLVADVIQEMAYDGTLIDEWNIFDYLDVGRRRISDTDYSQVQWLQPWRYSRPDLLQ